MLCSSRFRCVIPLFNETNPNFIHSFRFSSSPSTIYTQFNNNPHHENLISRFNRLTNQIPTPPISQFGRILASLALSNRYSIALSFHQKLHFKGIKPDLFTYNVLINCFSQLGHTHFAFSLFANILKRGYHPDIVTFNTLINGLCLKGEVHKALNFF